MTEDEFMLFIADNEKVWLETYPSGEYWIYCLTSGSWDRPTLWGLTDNMDDAIARVKSRRVTA